MSMGLWLHTLSLMLLPRAQHALFFLLSFFFCGAFSGGSGSGAFSGSPPVVPNSCASGMASPCDGPARHCFRGLTFVARNGESAAPSLRSARSRSFRVSPNTIGVEGLVFKNNHEVDYCLGGSLCRDRDSVPIPSAQKPSRRTPLKSSQFLPKIFAKTKNLPSTFPVGTSGY
eukprot:scaffold965_cov120-Isochrysis_galbana.AAC.17